MNFALASIHAVVVAFASSPWRPSDVRSTHGRHSVCGLHYRSTVSLTSETVLQHFGGNIALPLSLYLSLFFRCGCHGDDCLVCHCHGDFVMAMTYCNKEQIKES